MLDRFRYVQRFRVPFADIDMLRHVNNAAYIRWAEQIRCEYFVEVLGEDIRGERGIIMAKLEIQYERPVEYREHIAIGCRVSRIGRKSLDFAYEIWSEDRNVRCTHAVTPVVAMNYLTGETIVVPDAWRAKVAAFERPEEATD
jgi:acyl-CoA thioester hydrolase